MNAINYTHEGGSIRCEWRGFDARGDIEASAWPVCQSLQGGPWAGVKVEDDGIGIADEDLDRIFERFYRVNNQGPVPGTGLGLAIARELVSLHSGALSVRSRVGVGSAFAFYLPAIGDAPYRENGD
jgi:signal transduction histidine kinase